MVCRRFIGLLVALAACFSTTARAQVQIQMLRGTGGALDVDETRLMAGAMGDVGRAGAVTFFRWDGRQWVQEARITHRAGSYFGGTVALDGNRALTGDAWDDEGCGERSCYAGAAYAFERTAEGRWVVTQKLLPDEPVGPNRRNTNFGYHVALSGTWALITGASPGPSYLPPVWGAYFFEYVGGRWIQRQRVSGRFDVDLKGEVALLGNRVYRLQGRVWVQEAVLEPGAPLPPGHAYANYGFAVALDQDQAAVSALHLGPGGQVFVFRRQGTDWVQDGVLEAGTVEDTRFGSFVAIAGRTVVVGDFAEETGGYGVGSAYVFERDETGWAKTGRLYGSHVGHPVSGGRSFGSHAVLFNRLAVIGASLTDAYVFDLDRQAAAPEPLMPRGPAETRGDTGTFQWSAVPGARAYRLQSWLHECCGNGVILYLETGLADTIHTIRGFPASGGGGPEWWLNGFTQFAWRVEATLETGEGPYSAPAFFTHLRSVATPVAPEPAEAGGPASPESYPNPFDAGTTIAFSLDAPGWVRLALYDVLGREVGTIVDEVLGPGTYRYPYDGTALPGGLYFARLETPRRRYTLALLKAR